jgi:2-polyprenyl-3-methyl-5-hydroxy-6-metoxy-1,4-benzoquinol methylase
MFEKLEACPVCSHTSFSNHLICEDHAVSEESFALVKCRKCSLLFTNPRPAEDSIDKYYQSDQYISHSDRTRSLLEWTYQIARFYTLRKKHKLIRKYHGGKGSILDYGCGTGHFLHHCKRKGWLVTGIEPNEKANTIAAKKLNQPILHSPKDIKQKYDIITAWHVLEHVPDPMKTLKLLRKRLNPGGYIFLAVPNHLSYDAIYYGKYWAGYDVPRHLYHFNQPVMEFIAKKRKMKLQTVLHMPWDSYYVSWLSETYQNQNPSLRTAWQVARKSNEKARDSGQYSSLLYIMKK